RDAVGDRARDVVFAHAAGNATVTEVIRLEAAAVAGAMIDEVDPDIGALEGRIGGTRIKRLGYKCRQRRTAAHVAGGFDAHNMLRTALDRGPLGSQIALFEGRARNGGRVFRHHLQRGVRARFSHEIGDIALLNGVKVIIAVAIHAENNALRIRGGNGKIHENASLVG
ncbi:MAG: hypothetical protein JO293_08855, partial [Candidatus Eremiobacteraeota bacterium]|nr:hypothetical protein [Candidatus Eremiobacteraeota bacterium]